MKTESNIPCPAKIWQALDMAIEDLQAIEKLPEFCVNMSVFIGEGDSQCSVCLAGSVMVRRLDADWSSSTHDFPGWQDTLFNLSDIALGESGIPEIQGIQEIEFTDYNENKKLFFKYLDKVAETLKENDI